MNPRVLSRVLYVVLRISLGAWLRWRFRVRIVRDAESESLRPPYVVLANHVNFWDPFLVMLPFGPPIHFIAADGNFRGRFMRRFMNFAGTIPKAKAKNDLESIRTLQTAVANRKVVGIFPEGQRSWDGTNRPVLPGTPKLVRLLGVPVVSVRLKGGYLSMPRWTHHLRRGVLELHVTTVITKEEISHLSRTEITDRIAHSVDHNETQWQRSTGQIFCHPRRAEHIEQALFFCPDCGAWDSISSNDNYFACTTCGTRSWMAPSGRIYRARETGADRVPGATGAARTTSAQGSQQVHPAFSTFRHRSPDSVAAWNALQLAVLTDEIGQLGTPARQRRFVGRLTPASSQVSAPEPLPVVANDAHFYTGYRSRVLTPHGPTRIKLTAHYLTITHAQHESEHAARPASALSRRPKSAPEFAHSPSPSPVRSPGNRFAIPVAEITGVHVQYAHQLEFYRRQRLYVFCMTRPSDSAYRFEETILALQKNTLRNQ